MQNLGSKIKELSCTFEEMVANWTQNGYYKEEHVRKQLITDLDLLRQLELFFLDIESFKNLLFIYPTQYMRNSYEMGSSVNLSTLYTPTIYAKKWFPFDFLFKQHFNRSEYKEFKFFELSDRFRYFYLMALDLLVAKIDEPFSAIRGTDIFGLKKKDRIEQLRGELNCLALIDNMSYRVAEAVNETVILYRQLKKEKINSLNIDASYTKKKKEYIDYLKLLLDKHGSLMAVSINFYLNGNLNELHYGLIKKKFLNSLRTVRDLSMIAGYMGTWEFSPVKEYYFRIVFFIPKKQMYKAEIFEEVIVNHWNNFQYKHKGEMTNLKLDAEVSNLSHSQDQLKKSHCIIPNHKDLIFEKFVDTVINYTVLADKYFFPYELQIFLYCHSSDKKQIPDEHGYYIIDNLKYTFSRSFRGHIRKN